MPQTLTHILVHCVFHKKRSAPIIRTEDHLRAKCFVQETCSQLRCPCLIANGTGDHLHLLVYLSPTVSLSDLVKEVKRVSTNFLKKCDSIYYKDFHWQAGYAAFSVSYKLKEVVYQYIAQQEEHHRKQSLEDEFMALLRNAHIEGFEEEYYWT